jgi:hypothetical protein
MSLIHPCVATWQPMWPCSKAKTRLPLTVCSSVQQCAAVCSSVQQCAAVCSSVQQCATVCSSVQHCAAVCSRELQKDRAGPGKGVRWTTSPKVDPVLASLISLFWGRCPVLPGPFEVPWCAAVCSSVQQCASVCSSVQQCAAVFSIVQHTAAHCCTLLQCATVCSSVQHCAAVHQCELL